ncbi:MAG: thermonuclease family protein [Victivallales bacterium]|nr:thermonuclease family protein [Victivallales bacterium]
MTLTQPLDASPKDRRNKPSEPSARVVERFSGTVVRVSDGDTFDVETLNGDPVRIRIYGIDAPELAQPFGKEALKYVNQRVSHRWVMIEKLYDDQYGRCVGRVIFNGKDFALELLRKGIVWHYVQYCDDPAYAEAERQARKANKGLWRRTADGEKPIPPWEYRKAHPRRKK